MNYKNNPPGTEEAGSISYLGLLQPYSNHQYHQPVFVGNAGEFFRIWIVNMLLSLLTLGIWSAWATVRNRRYLYGNSEFAGNRLDFHGNPWAILRGRILAVVLFLGYAVGGDFYYAIPVVAVFLLIILFPWMLTSALRFRLSNTSWRNLRFDFSATFKTAYKQLGLPIFLILLTLGWYLLSKQFADENQTLQESFQRDGFAILLLWLASFLLVPLAIHRIRNLTINNVRYGKHSFLAEIRLTRFMGFYARAILVLFATFLLTIFVVFVIGKLSGGLAVLFGEVLQGTRRGTMILVYVVTVMAYLLPLATWNVTTTNYTFSATRFENLQFEMNMGVWAYWWIMVTNAVIAVLSLGLAIPWTKIRMLKYKLSCLYVKGELQVYEGGNTGKQTATGDEIGDAFDIDFGF
ncbi:MAG: DUF898 domain-containing protein [Gammaproteobacteria bacterium]|nr:DUF898 domain-containing protein [Gammaproteobacteria bacterium]